MLKVIKIIVFPLLFLLPNVAISQNIQGLQEIVKDQQDKISNIEDNLKKLTGSIEQNSNLNKSNLNLKLIENKISEISRKLSILENNIKNITNLSYDLDFALKRVERHLELSRIQGDPNISNVLEPNKKNEYKVVNKPEIKQKSLDPKTEGVLGFIKENDIKENAKKDKVFDNKENENSNNSSLPKGTAEENYNYALDLANQLDFENAEKALKDFLIVHKDNKKTADVQYWLGRVYFAQKKFEEAAIALAEFNSVFPNDPRFQETTLLIAESAVNFAPKDQLCDILNQSLEFMVNPSDKFVKRINTLKNEKQCTAG